MNLDEIRLLQLIKSTDIGGTEKYIIQQSNLLADKIKFVGIFARPGFYSASGFISSKVHLFEKVKTANNPLIFTLLNFPYLLITVAKSKINIVNYHHRIYAPQILMLRLFFPKIKIIYTSHSIFSDGKNKFLSADIFIAVSNSTKRDLEKAVKKKINVIYPGILIPPEEKKFQIGEIRAIGYVGRFIEAKGIIDLIKAFEALQQSNPALKLILRGEGSLEKKIKDEIKNRNLTNKILVEPPVISNNNSFDGIDLLVSPSRVLEGFGLALIEAMSCKIPVIASQCGGFCEIIEDGINGLLFTPRNTENLISAITCMLGDAELRDKFITLAYNDVCAKFDINQSVSKYLNLLEGI